MRSLFLIALTTLILLTQPINTRADVAAPGQSPKKPGKVVLHTDLEIVPDAKVYEARLQIPKDSLKHLLASTNGEAGGLTLAQSIGVSSTRTIFAGLFLTLTIAFGGIWLARSGWRRSSKAVASVLVLGAMSSVAVVALANVGPVGFARWRGLPQNLSQGRATQGGLDIEIVDEGAGMKLIIPLRNQTGPGAGE